MGAVQFDRVRDGRERVIIEGVSPQVEGGRFPVKRIVGDEVVVEADVFGDGHDSISAVVKYKSGLAGEWNESALKFLNNDRWRGSFFVTEIGCSVFAVEGWVDHFKSWRKELEKKFHGGVDVTVELLAGSQLIESAAEKARGKDAGELRAAAASLKSNGKLPVAARVAIGGSSRIAELMWSYSEREYVSRSREFRILVDPALARFGAWYEIFPRSASSKVGKHGTFKDCEALLPRVAKMGFDILYFPPIHPIGKSFRKGRNNNPKAKADEPGSPWAIGSSEGGHKAIHSELGTLEDFRRLVEKARKMEIQIALDIAFQCSPDHPYVKEHSEWFKKRPDGTIQYAENPPKKYQDIYPINFETEDWENLWLELKSIFDFWIEQGVHIFRVDNPHTKSFHFWEWCIGELKGKTPDLIFLSEAFTRPKLMYYLAKAGFTQSYNYFPWRNTKHDLTTYLTEITQGAVREFFRPNLWPNTPDILTEYLQHGGKPAFIARLILAATLGASYGIYGPPFEMCENKPRESGSEEYLNSEKYEIRDWDLSAPGNLSELIARVNEIRRENPALQSNDTLRFHRVDNEQLIAYSKQTPDRENIILVVVNLDPHHAQRGWVTLPLEEFGLKLADAYQVQELLTNAYYLWSGPRNYIELDPKFVPAHIFRLRKKIRTEHDFDYFF
jgi:starch synthase (maltosyl-transferring)